MTSKNVAELLVDLGVFKSHSRPHLSEYNPFSQAQFKTLKYPSEFPERFGSTEDARGFCRELFFCSNTQHRHSGIELMTPEAVHYSRTTHLWGRVRQVLTKAFEHHTERPMRKPPMPPPLATAV
jgi:transposase InsO family protein